MKAKKRFLALFFSMLMIWQGFFFAKAEGEDFAVLPVVEELDQNVGSSQNDYSEHSMSNETVDDEVVHNEAVHNEAVHNEFMNNEAADRDNKPTKPISFSKEIVNGGIQEVKDKEGEYHYILEYVVRFDAKNFEGQHNEDGYDNLTFQDSLKSNMLRYFNPALSLNSDFEDKEKYYPLVKKGVWRSGEYRDDGNGGKVFVPAEDDAEHRGPVFSLRSDEEGRSPAEKMDNPKLEYSTEYWSDNDVIMQYLFEHLQADEGFEIRYFVEIIEYPQKGTKYKNKAEILNLGVKAQEHTYTVQENPDTFTGKEYSFTIEKADKQSGIPLKGAEFLVSSVNTGYKKLVETGEDGKVTVHNLIKEYYDIEEINPPENYKMNEEEEERLKSISPEQFDDPSEIVVRFQNEKRNKNEDPDKRDIIVEKKWHVKPGDPEPAFLPVEDTEAMDFSNNDDEEVIDRNESFLTDMVPTGRSTPYSPLVTIYLLKDGQVIREADIDPQKYFGDAEYIFKDLPRKDADGKEIIYTVKEKPLTNYTTTITGSQDTKFTIMNNYSEGDQSMIPVTKIWRGEGPHPRKVEVILFENRKAVKSALLNDGNDWQYHFERNKTDEYNQPIHFEVKEVPVEGYETSVESDPDTGYLNVLINTKKSSPNNSDNGVDTPSSPNDGKPVVPPQNGGGQTPRTGETSSSNGSAVLSVPSENQGEVLGSDRPIVHTEMGIGPQIFEEEKVPKVLGRGRGRGRGWTKTFDSSIMKLYFTLFLLSTAGLGLSLVYKKRKNSRKARIVEKTE